MGSTTMRTAAFAAAVAGVLAVPRAAPALDEPCPAPDFLPVLTSPSLVQHAALVAAEALDANRDGYLDLAVATRDVGRPGRVELWLHMLYGDYWSAAVIADADAHALETADLDGSGDADVLFTTDAGVLHVYLADGSGGFAAAATYDAGCGAGDLVAGDFNGDGATDAAVACPDADPLADAGALLLYAGDGAGGFAGPARVPLPSRPAGLAAARLNADAHLDVAIALPATGAAALLLGDGLGGFAVSQAPPAGEGPFRVGAADLDGDGDADLALLNDSSDDVSVLLGSGDGTFTAHARFPAADAPVSLELHDVNGDAIADAIVGDAATTAARVLLGDGNGVFAPPVALEMGPAGAWMLAAVRAIDINADGRLDLVSANGSNASVSVRFNRCGIPATDLAITSLIDNPDPVAVEHDVTYTVTVENRGPAAARDVWVVFSRMSNNRIVTSLASTRGTCTIAPPSYQAPYANFPPYWCAIRNLEPGAAATLSAVVRPVDYTDITAHVDVFGLGEDTDGTNNGLSQATVVLAVGGRGFTLEADPWHTYSVRLRWSIGDAQGGYVIGRWVNGSVTQLPASGPLQYWRSDYSDEHMVSRTFNCYFVVPVDALGSLGHSTTACIVPGFQSPGHFPTGYQIRLDEPNTARLSWYAPVGEWTGWALVAHPMVRGSTARTILLDHDAASFADDTGGVTTCYVLFVLGTDGAAIGNSEPLCVIPGFSTIAPRGMAPVAGPAAGPSPIQADVGALRSAIEDARALLQLRR